MTVKLSLSLVTLSSVLIIVKSEMQACPKDCSCFNTTVNCSRVVGLNYIPRLPQNTTRLIYIGNKLSSVKRETFYNITQLNLLELNLPYNKIENISTDAMSELKHIQKIDLSGNAGLGVLDVAGALRKVPPVNLSVIVLNNMGWKVDPNPIFEALSSPSFKIRLFNMTNMELRTLNFSAIAKYLPELEILNLRFNSIDNLIPGNLSHLKSLHLAFNYIELEEGFFGRDPHCLFPNLEFLDLKANFVNYFEGRFSCLKNLRILKLGKNPVKHILNDTFSQLKSLEKLSITNIGGRLYFIDKFAFRSKTLKTLNFSGNYFNFSPQSMKYFYFYPDNIFNYSQNLETLILSENKFYFDSHDILLRMLIPLQKLKSLTLQHCALTVVPVGIFYNLPNLRMLDLSRNHIKAWDGKEVFQNTTSIELLNLNLNYISSFKESLFPVPLRKHIKFINLAGNPFSCCCKNLWLRKWIEESPNKFQQYPESYFCDTPPELHQTFLKDYFPTDGECESRNALMMITTTLSLIGIFVVILASLVYKGRWHIRHAVYLCRLKRRGYGAIEDCTKFSYSGFVIYCEDDREWVLRKFLKMVEINERRLCIHHRDFEVGKLIIDNIAESIAESRKVILILSNAMIKSDWCLFELRLANKKFLHREDSLLIIMLEHVPKKYMPSSLHTLLSIATYLQWSDDPTAEENFWKKVRRAVT